MAIVHLLFSVPHFHEYIKLAKGLWSSGIFLEKVGYTRTRSVVLRISRTMKVEPPNLFIYVSTDTLACVYV
jgi:hypothetical protein